MVFFGPHFLTITGASANKTVSLYVSNVQGSHNASKIALLRARTSNSDFIILNEVNRAPGDEKALALKCKSSQITNSPKTAGNSDRNHVAYGTFLGVADAYPDKGDFIEIHDFYEIGVIHRKIVKGLAISVIGMYRSPSMRIDELNNFYTELSRFVETRVVAGDDIIFIAGDDNSSHQGLSGYAATAYKKLEAIGLKFGGVHCVNKPTHKNHQPDHVVGIFDPLQFHVVPSDPIPGVGDHCEMHITIDLKKLTIPKQVWSKKKIPIDNGDFDYISEDLQMSLSQGCIHK